MAPDFMASLSGSPVNNTATSGINTNGASWGLGSGDWNVSFDASTGGSGYGAGAGFPGLNVGTVAPTSGAHAATASASFSMSPVMVAVALVAAWLVLRH